jgi:hypothetical protein
VGGQFGRIYLIRRAAVHNNLVYGKKKAVVLVAHSHQSRSKQRSFVELERTADVLTDQSNRLRFALGFSQSAQIYSGKLHRPVGMDDLDRLPGLCFKAGAPHFMTPDNLIEAPLQNIGLQWADHTDRDALVVKWRVSCKREFARVELLLHQ